MALAAPDRPLGYQDEEKVKRFDHHYGQAKANLDGATDDVLRRPTFAQDFERRTGFAKEALDGVSIQTHGEVTRRRAQLAELRAAFEKRHAAAAAELGDGERATIAGVDRKREQVLAKLLELDGKRTILTGDRRAPGTLFDDDLRKLRAELTGMRNPAHADVVAALQRLTDTDDAVAAAKAACQEKLAELGDLDAVAGEHVGWIMQRHHIDSSRNLLLPHPPETITPEAYRAYAGQLKEAAAALQRRVDYLLLLPAWVPSWGSHELAQRASRAVQVSKDALRDPAAMVTPRSDSLCLTTEQIDALPAEKLRYAVTHSDTDGSRLTEAVQWAEAVAAFREAWTGKKDAAAVRTLTDLRARKARYDERLQAQLDSERLPPPGKGHARYAATVRGLFRTPPLAVVIYGDLEHYSGTDTSKQEVSRRGVGNGMEEVTYRVHKYPYDYDFLGAYVVREVPEKAGLCKVFYVEAKKNRIRYGDEPVGQWFLDGEEYVQHCMRKENVQAPPVEEVAAATPAPAPATSTPTTQPPADSTPPEPTPPDVAAQDAGVTDPAPEKAGGGLGVVLGVVLGGGCCLLVLVGAGVGLFLAKAKAAAPPPAAPG